MTLTCVVCGEPFERTSKGRRALTCSPECRLIRNAEKEREARWRRRGGPEGQGRTCLQCGGTFMHVRGPGVLGRGTAFCSDQCRKERAQERGALASAAHRKSLTAEQRAARRRSALLAAYGLTAEQFEVMVAAQGGVCAICKQPEGKHHSLVLKIDHDRSCCPGNNSCGHCVRGLLCSNCNRALGLFGDDPSVLRAAAVYLERLGSRDATV